jgi:hypothetical protein
MSATAPEPKADQIVQQVTAALTSLLEGSKILDERWAGPPVRIEPKGVYAKVSAKQLASLERGDREFAEACNNMRAAVDLLRRSARDLAQLAADRMIKATSKDTILRLRNAAMAALADAPGGLAVSNNNFLEPKLLRSVIPFSLEPGECRRWLARDKIVERYRRRYDKSGAASDITSGERDVSGSS